MRKWGDNMEKVYICGHKNPDTDSIASAVAYAYLKSQLDNTFDYTPIRCGSVNEQTKFIFKRSEAVIPEYMQDIYPKVAENMSRKLMTVRETDPISKILTYIREHGIRLIPVTDDENNYKGMAGVSELTELFIRDDRAAKPVFCLRSDTLRRSLKADILNVGDKNEFNASIVVATMAYESFGSHLNSVSNEENTILVTGNRKNILDDVFARTFPAIVIVGLKEKDRKNIDFKGFKGWVFASPFDSAQTIRCIEMATPVSKVMNKVVPVSPRDYVDTVTETMTKTGAKALPVVDENKLIGIITGTDVIKKKHSKLIMMDHNELTQAIDGAESCDIVEIVDHHRLGTIRTNTPVYFYAKPVGSTCTLVYQLYKQNRVKIPPKYAMLLLSGMLSDTVIMKSPTTTKEDIEAIEALADYCGVSYKEYGVEIFSATDGLASRTAKDIIGTDFKIFEEYGVRFGVSQVETVTLKDVENIKASLLEELQSKAAANNLAWTMILITDIIKEESILITTSFKAGEEVLPYKRINESSFLLPGVLSRKKQLLPELLKALETIAK